MARQWTNVAGPLVLLQDGQARLTRVWQRNPAITMAKITANQIASVE
jgi:hypothetical protein